MTRGRLIRGLTAAITLALGLTVLVINDKRSKAILFEEGARFYVENTSTEHPIKKMGSIPQGKIELLDPAEIERAKYFISQLKFRSYKDYLAPYIGSPYVTIEIKTEEELYFMSALHPVRGFEGQWHVKKFDSISSDETRIYTMPPSINEQAVAFIESIRGKELLGQDDWGKWVHN